MHIEVICFFSGFECLLQIAQIVANVIFNARYAAWYDLAADAVGFFKEIDLVPTARSHGCKQHAGGPGAHHRDLLLCFRGRDGLRHDILEAGAGIDRTLRVPTVHKLVDAAFLAADAGTDFTNLARICLVRPFRIGQQRATEHDQVAHFIAQRLLRKVGVAKFADGDDGHGEARVADDLERLEAFLDQPTHVEEAASRHSGRGMREPPVIIAAEVNVKQVHTGLDQIDHVVERLFHGASVFKFPKRFFLHALFAVGLV
ncbi:hypothetical protein SDC9_138776 [bioreactor metagenome]|uniref:Uncharacterized protein n=1 Tax=bioreactor metagenome TaxID=1076179 RepID=A0A645DQU8_9ZZZZ